MSDRHRRTASRRRRLLKVSGLFTLILLLVPNLAHCQENAHEPEAVHAEATAGATEESPATKAHDSEGEAAGRDEHGAATHTADVPSLFWIAPFVILLGCIALLPLIPATEHWWHKNTSKLLVAAVLALITVGYYWARDFGFPHGAHHTQPGLEAVKAVLHHAVIADYIPFIVLLLSLFVISGGINVRGDVAAHPSTNTGIIALGGLLASFIGTTGAAMLLIRPLLQINQERKKVVHTVVFFIFVVCNIGGSLLPIGDPRCSSGICAAFPSCGP